TRLAADGNEAIFRLQSSTRPAQACFQVFKRRFGDVGRKARRFEIAQCESLVAARCQESATWFVDASARSIEDYDDGMRPRSGWREQRADKSLLADLAPLDAGGDEPLGQSASRYNPG